MIYIKELYMRYSCFRQVHIKFLYNSKFDFTAKSLVTNAVVIKRVLCTINAILELTKDLVRLSDLNADVCFKQKKSLD